MNALWRGYLQRDFKDAIQDYSELYETSPKDLYESLYTMKKNAPRYFLLIRVDQQVLNIVNHDAVRLANFILKRKGVLHGVYDTTRTGSFVGKLLIWMNIIMTNYHDYVNGNYKFYIFGSATNAFNKSSIVEISEVAFNFPNTSAYFYHAMSNQFWFENEERIKYISTSIKYNGKRFVNANTDKSYESKTIAEQNKKSITP